MPRYAKITKSKRELQDLLDYQKSKTKWYMNEVNELKAAIKKHEGELAKRDAKVSEAMNEVELYRERNKRLVHNNKVHKYNGKQTTQQKRELKQEVEQFKSEVVSEIAYLTKDRDWDKDISRPQVMEIILRTIVTYNRLIQDEIINFNELAYLIIGSQKDAFNIQDVRDRYGRLGGRCKQDFAALVEAGMISKVYRKQAYWLTEDGRERFNDILRYIYESKVGTYRVLKKVFKLEEK